MNNSPRCAQICTRIFLSIAMLCSLPPAKGHDEATSNEPVDPTPWVTDFRLTDHRGLSHELFDLFDARAVVLIFDENLSPEVEALLPEIQSPGADHDILDFCVRELGALGGGG